MTLRLFPRLAGLVLAVAPLGAVLGQTDAGSPVEAGLPPTDAGVADASVPPLAGSFRLADAAEVDAADARAIDAVLRNLHPSMRDAFRAELSRLLRAPRSLVLRPAGTDLTVVEDGTELRAPVGGAAVRVPGPSGRSGEVRHARDGDVYVQTLETGNFRRTRRLTRTPRGLTSDVELRSRLLPRPLTQSATYLSAHDATAPDAGAPAAP